MRAIVTLLAVIVVGAEAALLLGGYRVLVGEQKVEIGQHRLVEGWGDLSSNSQASLVCSYFTGRSVKEKVFWYAAGGVMGRDQCPFVLSE